MRVKNKGEIMKRYKMKNLLAIISAVLFLPLIFGAASDLWAFQLVSSTTINGAGNAADGGGGITVDPSGNIWVTGYSSITVQGANIWIGKYNSSMVLQSSTTINGSGNGTDYGNDIAADPSGNIWVAGSIVESAGGMNIWLAKYNSSMVLQASTTINGSGNGNDAAYDVAVDPSGNILFSGAVTESVGGVNIWLAKYNSSMVLQSSRTINGASSASDYGQSIAADPGGNIWATGQVMEPVGGENIWIAKYNSSLVLQSSTTINGPSNGADCAFAISTGPGGSIWVTGFVTEPVGGSNIWIAKYDSSLVLQSSATISGSASLGDEGQDITADASGNIWVMGGVNETVGAGNIWLAKYDSSMVLQSSRTFDGSASGNDAGMGIVAGPGGKIWGTGTAIETVGAANIWIAKFAEPSVNLLVQNAASPNFRYSATNPVLKLSLWTDVGTSNWSQLALLVGGNLNPASDTGSVYLYRDANADGVYNSSDTYVTFMSPVSGGFTLNFSETIGVSTGVYFVTMTPNPSAIGRTAVLTVSSTNSIVANGPVYAAAALPVQSVAAKVMNYIYATETGASNPNTDISVLAGQALQINATGYWSYGAAPVNAAGSGVCSVGCPMPSAPRGALIAGGVSTPWFVVGLSTTVMLSYSDTLRLAMNDDTYGDNTGYMMFEKAVQAVTKIWTGAACGPSSCFEASNPGNWQGNMMPAYGDNVVFSTGAKNCGWDLSITPNSLSLNPGYTGRISLMTNNVQISDYLRVQSGTMDIAGNTLVASTVIVSGGALDLGGGYGYLRVGEGGLNVSSSGTLVFNGTMNANIERIAAGYFPISVTGGTVAVNGAGLLNIFGSNGITISNSPALTFNNVRITNLQNGAAALRLNAASGNYAFNNWGFDSSVSTNVTAAGLSGSATIYMNNSVGERRGTPYEYDTQNRIIWNPDGGGAGSISGSLAYGGLMSGDYRVFVTTDMVGPSITAISTPAPVYQFAALDAPATYYLWAIKDMDSNGLFTAALMEPMGWTAVPVYLSTGAALTVDLTLLDTGKITGNIDRSATSQAGRTIVELHSQPTTLSTSTLIDLATLEQWAYTANLAAYAVAAPSATYTVLAYIDVNQNGHLDPAFESSGTLTGLAISTQTDLPNQDIVLSPGAAEAGGLVTISTAAFAGNYIGKTNSVALLKLGLVSNGLASTVISLQFRTAGTAQADKFSLTVYKDDGNGIFDNDPSAANPMYSDTQVGYNYFDGVSSQAAISFYQNVEINAGATQYLFVTMMPNNPAVGSTIGAVLLSSSSVGLLKGTMADQALYPVSTPLRTVRESIDAWSTFNTGLYPMSGQTVNISAFGQWLVNGVAVSPGGSGGNMYNGVISSVPVGALIAQVGYNSPWIYVGTSTTFVYSGPSGELMLHMNANYDFANQMWNYPSGVSGRLYLDYSVAGDTHAVLSGTVTYSGVSVSSIIVNAIMYTPAPVIIGTHTIMTSELVGNASYYTMTGIEIPTGNMADVTVSAYLKDYPAQRGTGAGGIQVRIGQPATGGNVTVYPGLGVLAGTVTYSGSQQFGNTVVALFSDMDGDPIAVSTLAAGVSTFTVTDIPGPASYYVLAFKDANNNYKPDGPEPLGYYGTLGPLSLLTTNAYLVNVSSGVAVTTVPAAIVMQDMGQISGTISLGDLQYGVRVVVSAGHGVPGSSFVGENRVEYYAQPCYWYGCVNEVYYNVGTLFPGDDYSVVAFMDKNNNWQWDCPDAQNCEKFASSRTGIAVSANSIAQADITMTAAATPEMPQAFSGAAQNTSQILWTWNDVPTETGYYLVTSTGGLLYTQLSANATQYLETVAGGPNTMVMRGVMARNGAGDSPISSVQTRYTKADAPGLTVNNRTSSSVALNITGATNRFALERSTFSGGGYNVVYSSYTGTPVTARTDTGLTPGVTYYFRAQNYNGDNIVSAYASEISTVTLPPSGSYINGTVNYPGLMPGNITVLASTSLLLTSPIVLTLPGNTTQSYYLSGLTPSTSYYVRAFVDYNADGLLHASEDASVISTTAVYVPASGGTARTINIVRKTAVPAAPSGLVATPGFQRVELRWTAPSAANIAGYEVYRSTFPTFSQSVVKVSGGLYVSGTSFTDLNPVTGSPAYYRVRAMDWGVNPSTWTTLNTPVNVSAGGSITGIVNAVDTSTAGFYHVRVSTTPDANVPSIVDILVSTSPNTYTVSGLADGTYYVRGYRDINSDFKQDRKQEPSGTHGGIARPFDLYVTQGSSLTGINLKVCNRIPLAAGTPSEATISAAGCEALDRGPGYYTRIYTFEVGYGAGKVPPGSQVTVYANNVSGISDAYLYLVGPSGDVAAWDDDSGGSMNPRIQYTVDTPGVYLIEPTSYASGMTGTLSVGFDVTGGFGGQIAGTLSYSGAMTGTSIVQIFETLDTYAWPVMTSSTAVSAFTITGLRDGMFYLKAFKDVNGNGVRDSFEPYGVYGGTTAVQFSVSGGVTSASLAITLAEPAVGSVSGNLAYYGLRSGTVRLEAARPRSGSTDSYDMEVIKFSTVTHTVGTVDQAYSLTLLAPATDYTIRAFVDENGNNWKDLMEPFVSSQAVTITASTNTAGVNLVIIDPGSGQNGDSTLSGSISYNPTPGQGYVSTGTLWLGLAADQNFNTILYSQTISTFVVSGTTTAWTYSRSSMLGGTTYYLAAFLDLDLNNQPDESQGEPVGIYSTGTVRMTPVYVPTSSTVVRDFALVSPSTGYISGVVHYYGTMTGSARVEANNDVYGETSNAKDSSSKSYFTVVSGVTDYPFTLRFLNPTTSYHLYAIIDLNGNQSSDPGEPSAWNPDFTMSGSTAAVLTIMDPGQGQMYGGNIGEIRGTVVYNGSAAGTRIVRLFRGSYSGAPVQTLNISPGNCTGNSCTFTMSGLSCPDNYYLDAFVDASGNGTYEPAFEPHGSQPAPVGLTQMAPYSPNNSMTMYDPGGGVGVSTGSAGISGIVRLQGGGVTPSGVLRVQLFRFDNTESVMQIPVRVATYAYTTQNSVNYSFNNLPETGGPRYLVQAFVDAGTLNSFLDRNESRGQTKALEMGISTSAPAEQKDLSVCISTSIEPGQNLGGSLATTDCLSPDRGQTSAYMDYYSFMGSAGDVVTVEMTGTGFSDTYLYLYGPSMSSTGTYNSYNLLAYDDDSAGNSNAKINGYALPSDGVYTIGATSYGNSITGAYTVSLRVSGGTNGSIAGTVRYNGTQGGSINVGLFNSDPRSAPNTQSLTGTSMSIPGAFTFNNLPSGASYYIGGYVDVNANNRPDQGEDFGMYPNVITLRAGQNVTGTLLEINPSTQTVFVGGAGQGTISGAISYAGALGNTSLVIEMWNTATFRGMPVGIRTIPVDSVWPVSYDLQVPGDQTYYLKAFLDTNNNRMPDMDEAKGAYEPNNQGPEPIYVGSAAYVSDRNFTLYDPGQLFGVQGASGEGWASVYPSSVSAGTGFDAIVTVRVNGLAAGGVVMVGLPGNIYNPLNTAVPGPGYVQAKINEGVYAATNLEIPPPAPGSYMASNNVKYTVPAGGLAAGTSVYFYIQQLYAPCQGGMTGTQSDNRLAFHVGTSSNSPVAQPLTSGEPVVALGAGAARNLSFRLADNMNGYNMAVPNGELTAMLAETRDNCWNPAPVSSLHITTVSAYSYNMATYGYDADASVTFSTAAETAPTAIARVPFAVNSSSAVFYILPSASGYKNIGLSHDLAGLGTPTTFYMGVQVMSGGGFTGVNVSTGAYNNLSASSMTVTITPNGDGVSDRAYINFVMGDANMGWHVLVSSRPFRTGVAPTAVWETWGWGQPNPGAVFWEGRYNPWMNFGGAAPTGAYFVRLEAGSLRNDSLRINVVVPQVSGQVTDAGTSPQRPLSGVMVNTYGAFGWGQAVTDAGGNFVIPGLGAGQYNFQFSKEEYGMVSSQVVVGLNGATVNASMRRAPALTLLTSLTNGATQSYDQWGWINVHTADWSRSYNGSLRVAAGTTTIDDGGRWDAATGQFATRTRIRFDVEASTYTVDAELSGYGRVSSTVYVGSAGLELTMPAFTRKANLSGRVDLPATATNAYGTWISVNALPVVMSSSNAGGWGGVWLNQGLTSGTYNIFGVDPGSYTIRAQVPGYSGVSVSTFVAGADITGLDIPAFGTGSVIQGTVTIVGDTHLFQIPSWSMPAWPKPIRVNVNVWSPQTYSNGWTEIYVATAVTQAASTFTITGLDAGTTYQLFASLDYDRDSGGGNAEFTVPGGFPKQVYVGATSSGTSDFTFALASGAIFGTIYLPTTPAVDFSSVSMTVKITRSENPYAVGRSFSLTDITVPCGVNGDCLPNLSTDPVTGIATFNVAGMETQTIEVNFTYHKTGVSRTALVNVVSGSTVTAVVDLRMSTYSVSGLITNQVSNPLFNTMALAIANSSYTLPSGYPAIPAGTMPIEAVRRDLSEFGAAMTSTVFDPIKTRVGFITQGGTYTIRGLQEGVYVIRTRPLKACTTCEMSVAPQEKIVTIRGADYTANNRVIADGLSVLASSVNFTLIDGWNVTGAISIENNVSDARTLLLTLRNRRNEVVRSTMAALGNAGTNSLANSVAYSFSKLPGGEFYTLEVRDTKDSTGTIKYAAAPLRFPDAASSPNGMQSDLSGQNVTLKQGAMFTLKLRDVNSSSLLTQSNVTLLAENFSCFAAANPWVQGGYYVAASSVSGRPIEADGTVRIGPVMPGVYYDVKCEQSNWDVGYLRQGAQNYSPAVVSGIRPSAGETRDLGVLDLRQGQALRGVVRSRDGSLLSNIKVIAKPSYVENPLTVQTMSNRDGLYTLWVSTYVSRYFDITAAPREQNQTVEGSTVVYRESAYTAVDISVSSATVDFTLDPMSGGIEGSVDTIDGGALSYPFGAMQGFPAAALFIQPYGTVPRNNPIGDIEAITAAAGAFSVPLATGAYTMRVVSLGYSVPSVTFTVTGSGNVSFGNIRLVKGGTVSGQIRKPDSTATGGYTEPNTDEINLVAAANDGFTEFVIGTVVSDSVSRTITRYAISGFKPDIDYSLALMSSNGDMSFPSEGSVRFTVDESTGTKSINLTYRPSHGDCLAVSKRTSAGLRLRFVCSKAMRNRTAEDNNLTLVLTTSAVDSSGDALAAPNGTGVLSSVELSADRKQFTAIYSSAATEGMFSIRLAAYTSEVDQATGENFRIDRVYDFYTGVKAVAVSRMTNMRGGRVELESEENEDERGAVEFPPGTFALDGNSYALVTTTVAVEMLKADDLEGVTGVGVSALRGSRPPLSARRGTVPEALYEAMQALREQRVGNYRTKAASGGSAVVNPFSSFYDISLPAGISHVLQQPARITLSYDTALSSNTAPDDLNVYYYNPGSQRYVLEASGRTLDPDNGTISVNVDHLSAFVVLAQAPVVSDAYPYTGMELKAHNFPNPFNNKRTKTVAINNAIATGGYAEAAAACTTQGTCIRVFVPRGTTGEMKLKVFNIAGELVREMELTGYTAGATSVWPWDGKNDSGREVASGVYIGEVKVGGDKTFFKMAVIKDSRYQ